MNSMKLKTLIKSNTFLCEAERLWAQSAIKQRLIGKQS